MVERLWEAGWKPADKTKGYLDELSKPIKDRSKERLEHFEKYGWKVNETNLSSLPDEAPEGAKKLVERIIHDSRRSTLEEWFKAYNEELQGITGTFNGIGAWTHRMSHVRPNMANIAAEKSLKYQSDFLADIVKEYGRNLRSLWQARDGYVLVGTDAEGIQLRVLAHYINDDTFTQALVSGSKQDHTDCHSLNQRALGQVCRSRDNAKTFIYAFLLGAGIAKVAEIFGCSSKQAKEAVDKFIRAYPGLKLLKDKIIPNDASRGYFRGLDGRLVACDSEHLMLAGYLQNGEKVIMLTALKLWYYRLKQEGVPFKLVNMVHDEFVTETIPEFAEYVKDVQEWSIAEAGRLLNLNCPMAGSGSIGHTWYDIH
jgi:DNA polymerase-1